MNNKIIPKREPNFIVTGAIIGVSQTFIGHPIDTLKTLYQNKNSKILKNIYYENIKQNVNNKNSKISLVSRLYAGVSYPILINLTYNTMIYELHNKIYQNTNNHFISGFISGGMMSFILNPFEVGKIKQQVYYEKNQDIINSKNIKLQHRRRSLTLKQIYGINLNIYPGNCKLFVALPYTFLRESISTGLYFHTYFSLIDKYDAFNSGGIAGCASWLLTYPLDTYKTRVQANSKYEMKMNVKNFKSLWNGLSFCLVRAYLVNGIGFYIYNKLTK